MMSGNSIRLEQLVLGSALSGHNLPAQAKLLRSSDFYSPVAGHLYSDITRLQAEHPQWGFTTVAGQVGPGFTNALVSAELLCHWAATSAAADPGHVEVGIKMLLNHGSAAAIERETRRIGQAFSSEDPHGELTDAYARLGEAITRRTVELRDLDDHVEGEDALLTTWSDERFRVHRPELTDLPREQRQARVRQERDLLAGLIQHPEITWAIDAWLPDEVFTSLSRRDIYRVITEDFLPADADTQMGGFLDGLRHMRRTGVAETMPPDHTPDRDTHELAAVFQTKATGPQAAAAAREIYAADTAAYLVWSRKLSHPAPPPDQPVMDPPPQINPGPDIHPQP